MTDYEIVKAGVCGVKELTAKYVFLRADPKEKRIMIATDPPRKSLILMFDDAGKFEEVI